jgi:hypothetical protein
MHVTATRHCIAHYSRAAHDTPCCANKAYDTHVTKQLMRMLMLLHPNATATAVL